MEWWHHLGIAGFLFFLIKGLLWLLLFALLYFGVIDKKRFSEWRSRFGWRRSTKEKPE